MAERETEEIARSANLPFFSEISINVSISWESTSLKMTVKLAITLPSLYEEDNTV